MVCFRFSQGSYFKLNGFESRYSYCENYEMGFLLLLKKHKKQTKKNSSVARSSLAGESGQL